MSILRTLKFITGHPLNSDKKFKSIINYIKWQIGSRLVPGAIIYNWIGGAKIIVRNGETGLTGNIYCGLHEFSDMAYLLHAIEPADLFIDIGANVGSYTILACAARGARGYCIEPVPETYEKLTQNIKINNLSSLVTAYNIGLSDANGELFFTSNENCTNHVVTERIEQAGHIQVEVSTLDDLLEQNEAPSVIKIDVEGFETSILNGASNTLKNPSLHSVIMELNGSGLRYHFNEDDILTKMKDFGFSTYSYEPFNRKLIPLHGKNNQSGNTLFLRNEELINKKLHAAANIETNGFKF